MRRGTRRWASILLGTMVFAMPVIAAVGAIAGNEVNALPRLPEWMQPARDHPLLATTVTSVVCGFLGLLVWWTESRLADDAGESIVRLSSGRTLVDTRLPPSLAGRFVDRPDEMAALVAALTENESPTRVSVVGLYGAGGYGKSMLFAAVCDHPAVGRHFGGKIFKVVLGRDASTPALIAERINNAIESLTRSRPGYTDPAMAAAELIQLLGSLPRCLLALDDVWYEQQVTPFLAGAPGCTRLVSTRFAKLFPPGALRVEVARMATVQAQSVLLHGMPIDALSGPTVRELLRTTGRWPLLLALANAHITEVASTGCPLQQAATQLLASIRSEGPTAADDWGANPSPPSLDDVDHRRRLVRATVEAGTKLLQPIGEACFLRLGIFASGPIPLSALTALWEPAFGLDESATRRLCSHIDRLALAAVAPEDGGSLRLHDVIRDYLRVGLSPRESSAAHRSFVDGLRSTLTTTESGAGGEQPATQWWQLRHPYFLDHLIAHLLAGGLGEEARATATDLRWVETRLVRTSPDAPYADLTRLPDLGVELTPAILALSTSTHLLTSSSPEYSLVDILRSRLHHVPFWNRQFTLAAARTSPRLANAHPLPDTAPPALQRTLSGPRTPTHGEAWSPDGRFLAAVDHTGAARIWNPESGVPLRVFAGERPVRSLSWSPDSDLLATVALPGVVDGGGLLTLGGAATIWEVENGTSWTLAHDVREVLWAGDGRRVATRDAGAEGRIWDPLTGELLQKLHPQLGPLSHIAWSPGGPWLAFTDVSSDVYLLDATRGVYGHRLTGHAERVQSLEWSPDGRRLATSETGDTVRLWDPENSVALHTLPGHRYDIRSSGYSAVRRIVWSPDTGRLATLDRAGTARIWDSTDGQLVHVLLCPGVLADSLSWSPDNRYLIMGEADGGLRLWHAASGEMVADLPGQGTPTQTRWAPDGIRVSVADARSVRVWKPEPTSATNTLSGKGAVSARWSADGRRLVTRDVQGSLRLWSPDASGLLADHRAAPVHSIAWSPDGTTLLTGDLHSGNTGYRLWDVRTGTVRRAFRGSHGAVSASALSGDGTLFAAGALGGAVLVQEVGTDAAAVVLPGHIGSVRKLMWSPDDTRLMTVDNAGMVRVWNPHTADIQCTTHTLGPVTWSTDGRWLVTAGDNGTVWLRDPVTGSMDRVLPAHPGRVRSAEWAPRGARLAVLHDSSGFRASVRVCDLAGRTEAHVMDGLAGPARSLTWSPDGTFLSILDGNGDVSLWDSRAERIVHVLDGAAKAFSWSSDGRHLATVGAEANDTLSVWEPSTGRKLAAMRTEGQLSLCAWSSSGPLLAAGGEGGLFFFRLEGAL